jgi:hypothetical protein
MNVKEMEDSKSAMVYGYIHAKEGPMYFHWVQLRRTDAKGNEDYYTTRSNENGLFYAENLPLGLYQIHRIGQGNKPTGSNSSGVRDGWSSGVRTGGVTWSLGEASKDTTMHVKNAGVNYLGSFKYIYIEGEGFLGRDSFEFKRAAEPSEKELLKRLLRYTKGTRWEERIIKRVAEAN